ncbi:hypothetical protein QQ352_15065 (plasmid) [Enterococcus faecalis]
MEKKTNQLKNKQYDKRYRGIGNEWSLVAQKKRKAFKQDGSTYW